MNKPLLSIPQNTPNDKHQIPTKQLSTPHKAPRTKTTKPYKPGKANENENAIEPKTQILPPIKNKNQKQLVI